MSSDALTLTNRVLRLTGDLPQITGSPKQAAAIIGSVGGVAERIVEYLNLTIGDIERRRNWDILRVDASGLGNGVDALFDFGGTEDVRSYGGISIWITGQGSLAERTPEQLNELKAAPAPISGQPIYFTRKAGLTGKAQFEIFPVPSSGQMVNMTAYRKATRFDATVATSTTEFDDDALVYGAMYHLDAFDGLNRGYAPIYNDIVLKMIEEATMNREIQAVPESYS